MNHGLPAPSDWVRRWAHLIAARGSVLDLACGSGRHVRWLAARGHAVTGVDRDAAAVQPLRGLAEIAVADIEQGPWPWPGRCFDAVIVTNYLWRPLWPVLRASLAPGGCLIYETFAEGNERYGRPARPEFLLRRGELLQCCDGMQVVGFEQGLLDDPPRVVQRIAAVARDTAQPLAGPANTAG